MKLIVVIVFAVFGPVLAHTDIDEAQAFFKRHHVRSLIDDTTYPGETLLWRRGRTSKLTTGKSQAPIVKERPKENPTTARLKAIVAEREGSPPSYVERQANKASILEAHTSSMEAASYKIADANKSAAMMASRGEKEPSRSSTGYRNFETARKNLRQSQTEALQKVDTAANALRKGPAMAPATDHKLDQAREAMRKAHGLGVTFGEVHHAAGDKAADEKRWSDVPYHVKQQHKSATRNNAIVSYHDAISMEQVDQRNKEKLGELRNKLSNNDPRMKIALEYAMKSRRETRAARDHYAMSHGIYLDTRRRFPDGSSSEDEERKFP